MQAATELLGWGSPSPPSYYQLSAGTQCPTTERVATYQECNEAATALNLYDKVATTIGSPYDQNFPKGCFNSNLNGQLYWTNHWGGSTESTSRPICKSSAATVSPTLTVVHSETQPWGCHCVDASCSSLVLNTKRMPASDNARVETVAGMQLLCYEERAFTTTASEFTHIGFDPIAATRARLCTRPRGTWA